MTGDRLVAEHDVERIDMVKIDVEGADLAVLRGFGDSLATGRIRVAQFEYGYASVLARTFLLDFFELLEPNGYTIGEVHRQGIEPLRYRLERENFFGTKLPRRAPFEPRAPGAAGHLSDAQARTLRSVSDCDSPIQLRGHRGTTRFAQTSEDPRPLRGPRHPLHPPRGHDQRAGWVYG